MRKLIYQVWITLDGFAADAKGTTSFFEDKEMHKQSDKDILNDMDHIDTILIGANTYKMFVDFWPSATVDDEIIADRLNSTPKIVFSRSLTKAPWGKWPEATIKKDAVPELKQLKSQPGKDLVLWGSISLAQTFMKENLIDEYEVRVCPLLLGKGKLLFENITALELDCYEAKRYDSGLVLLKYRPKAR